MGGRWQQRAVSWVRVLAAMYAFHSCLQKMLESDEIQMSGGRRARVIIDL